jgi:23S rRNA (pseudouridine1915-N3)-methyltransferase
VRIHLLAVGRRQPGWINEGFTQYARRLPPACRLILTEIPSVRRSGSHDIRRLLREECERMRAMIPKGARVIALDERGTQYTTRQLADKLSRWLGDGRDIALLAGSADGLAEECARAAEEIWSLGPLTLPHGLVRVIVAEQIYRAWSMLQGHPYHRA